MFEKIHFWDVFAVVDDEDLTIYNEGNDLKKIKQELREGRHLEIISYAERDSDGYTYIEARRRLKS